MRMHDANVFAFPCDCQTYHIPRGGVTAMRKSSPKKSLTASSLACATAFAHGVSLGPAKGHGVMPRNAVTDRAYSGVNVFCCSGHALKRAVTPRPCG